MIKCFALVIFFVVMPALILIFGAQPQAQPATVTQGASIPSAQWLRDFDTFTRRNKTLQDKRAAAEALLQPELDSLMGMSQRLISQIPPGHQFDAVKRTFVMLPPAKPDLPNAVPPAVTTPPATAAPAEKPDAN